VRLLDGPCAQLHESAGDHRAVRRLEQHFIGDYNSQASTNDAVYPIFVGDGVPVGDSNTQEVIVAHVTP
jgi:hypothetical protein